MTSFLPAWPQFSAFLLASAILAITPGPGVLYIVMRTVAQGRAAGLASVAGVALGNAGSAVCAALGLAALFALSSAAYWVVKWGGAIYLVVLGVQLLRTTQAENPEAAKVTIQPIHKIFMQGFWVALLNPKTAIFFTAFLPQFMRVDVPALGQSVILGVIFVAIAALTDTLYALCATAVAHRFGSRVASGRTAVTVLALTFFALALMTVLTDAIPAAQK